MGIEFENDTDESLVVEACGEYSCGGFYHATHKVLPNQMDYDTIAPITSHWSVRSDGQLVGCLEVVYDPDVVKAYELKHVRLSKAEPCDAFDIDPDSMKDDSRP